MLRKQKKHIGLWGLFGVLLASATPIFANAPTLGTVTITDDGISGLCGIDTLRGGFIIDSEATVTWDACITLTSKIFFTDNSSKLELLEDLHFDTGGSEIFDGGASYCCIGRNDSDPRIVLDSDGFIVLPIQAVDSLVFDGTSNQLIVSSLPFVDMFSTDEAGFILENTSLVFTPTTVEGSIYQDAPFRFFGNSNSLYLYDVDMIIPMPLENEALIGSCDGVFVLGDVSINGRESFLNIANDPSPIWVIGAPYYATGELYIGPEMTVRLNYDKFQYSLIGDDSILHLDNCTVITGEQGLVLEGGKVIVSGDVTIENRDHDGYANTNIENGFVLDEVELRYENKGNLKVIGAISVIDELS